jgi:hypothetical protein
MRRVVVVEEEEDAGPSVLRSKHICADQISLEPSGN